MKKTIANIITFIRIVCSVFLLFAPIYSAWFYVLYVAAGVSDMLDGLEERKTHTTSEFGALLDSIADVIFVTVCLFKILPTLQIRLWLWGWIAFIATVKIINYASGFILKRKLIMPHTAANKITGRYLFIAPLIISFVKFDYLAVMLCSIATYAAIQEGYFLIKNSLKRALLF